MEIDEDDQHSSGLYWYNRHPPGCEVIDTTLAGLIHTSDCLDVIVVGGIDACHTLENQGIRRVET